MKKNISRQWVKQAACREAPTQIFFIDTKYTKQIEEVKKMYCRTCPVVQECLNYAILTDSQGLFGGMTRDERDRYNMWRSAFGPQLHGMARMFLNSNRPVKVRMEVSLNVGLQDNTPHEQEHPSGGGFWSFADTDIPSNHTQQALPMEVVGRIDVPSS